MNLEQDPKRWAQGDPEVPDELSRLLCDGQGQLGSLDEVSRLAGRLAAVLGPASGLPEAPEPAAPGQGAAERAPLVGQRSPGAGTRLVRWGKWLFGGASIIGSVWWIAGGLSAPPSALSPSARSSASVPGAALGAAGSAATPSGMDEPARGSEPERARPTVTVLEAPDAATPRVAPRPHDVERHPPQGAAHARQAASGSSEAGLLQQAQRALGVDPERALELARQHQRQFAHGALVEEREVIAIEALKRLGRNDAASARARAFERRYRRSVHRPRLEGSLDTRQQR